MSETHKVEGAKPCPFCGSTEIYAEPYEHAAGNRWRVLCAECMGQVDTGTFQTEGRALEAWNRRDKKTCQAIGVEQGRTQIQRFISRECSMCGYQFRVEEHDNDGGYRYEPREEIPNFCPKCGARVTRKVQTVQPIEHRQG